MARSNALLGCASALLALANAEHALVPRAAQTIHLKEAPMITETRPYMKAVQTSLNSAGVHTLGADGCGGLQCIGQVVNIESSLPPSASSAPPESSPPPASSAPPPPPPPTSSTSSTTKPTPTAGPPITCDKYGYLIQESTLYRVDLDTGGYSRVANRVGDGTFTNAMAYNQLDNYLYAWQSNKLIRMAADGKSTVVGNLATRWQANAGTIDNNGVFWYSAYGNQWAAVDLKPGSPKYGQQIASGSATRPSQVGNIIDWVYLPNGGRYLYAVVRNAMRRSLFGLRPAGTSTVRFNLDTKKWEYMQNYPSISGTGEYGAMYATYDGTVFASNNLNGEIWAFYPLSGAAPRKVSNGPKWKNNDGARCILADA
ncbi:hypothetical protein GQ53DRAFT_860922 [Thozetella sp. PMI_491]|nr:hypothetical protein GQ53DRAFT_860922 [Thozetella sp. PMI_491]